MRNVIFTLLLVLALSVSGMAQSGGGGGGGGASSGVAISQQTILTSTNQDGTVLSLVGKGITFHEIMWFTQGTISAGACGLQQATSQAFSGPSSLINAQTVTSTGGGTSLITGGVANFVKIHCSTSVAGTGSVTIIYQGFKDLPVGATFAGTITIGTVTANAGTGPSTPWNVQPTDGAGVAIGVLAKPFRTDPTGTTTQPVSIVAGSAVIGHVISDTGSVTQLVAGSAVIGHVVVDSGAVTVSSGTITAVTAITNALPAGTNVLGHIIVDACTGCAGAGGTSSNFGSAFPTPGTAIGFHNAGNNMDYASVDGSHNINVNCTVGCGAATAITSWGGGTLGAMANYGTSPGAVLVPGMNAFMTNIAVDASEGSAPTSNPMPNGCDYRIYGSLPTLTSGSMGYLRCNPQGNLVIQTAGDNLTTGQVSIGTSATLVSAARVGRVLLGITSPGTLALTCGGSGVTTGTGLTIQAVAASITFQTTAAVYCVVPSGSMTITFADTY